jgi:putative glutamine amidotransferase
MIRIGLSQRVEDLKDRGERRDCLDQQWAPLLAKIGAVAVPIPNRIADLATFVDGCDVAGFILTGGNDLSVVANPTNLAPERDATERAILELARAREMAVLGVCRGLQMMVVDGGGSLTPLTGHVAVRHALTLCAEPAIPITDRDQVNSFHDYGVLADDLGAQWLALATAPDGTVEAVCHRRHRQWGIMWHPERDPFDSRDLELMRMLFVEGD